jgi:hypothetical protein
MNFNVAFLFLTLTIVGVYSNCLNQGKIIILYLLCKSLLILSLWGRVNSTLSHLYFYKSSLISVKNSHWLCNLIHYFSGSQTGVWGEPHGGTQNVKFTDIILFGGHTHAKVVKLNVDWRIHRCAKIFQRHPSTVLSFK